MITYHVEGNTGAGGWTRLASVPTEKEARTMQDALRADGTFKGVRVSKLTITLEVLPDAEPKRRKRRARKVDADPFAGGGDGN